MLHPSLTGQRLGRVFTAFIAFLLLFGSGLNVVLAQTPEASPVASPQASPVASPVDAKQHGIRIEDMDLTVAPGDDFYQFANGDWLARTELPGDSPTYNTFSEIDDLVTKQLNEAIADLDAETTTDTGKVKSVYNQVVDQPARDGQGITPIQPQLDNIAAITTTDQALEYQTTQAVADGVPGLFSIYAAPSFEDATLNVAQINSFPVSLPSYDYYLVDSPEMDAVRTAWVETTAQLFVQIGYDEATAKTAAENVLAFESAGVAIMTPVEDYYADPARGNNPRTIAELKKLVPSFDWDGWLSTLGITGVDTLVVGDLDYFNGLEKLIADTDPQTIRDFYASQLIWSAAPYLTTEIGDIAFSFSGPILNGISERRPIDERALTVVQGVFPDAVGQAYVEQSFSPGAKAQIEELVDNIIEAYRQRILSATWMSETTRQKAIEKLNLISVKVGYPDEWKTYEDVVIGDSLYASMDAAALQATRDNLAEVGQPVDRSEWFMGAYEVNAYYNPQGNEIVFPAAILQAPFFDPEADAASNYGAIGMVIGHEITHGFDQSGSQYDGYGNLKPWWTDEDRAAFDALNQRAIDQYDQIEVLPGLDVDGELTVTENVADMGGIQVAYDALLIHLDETDEAQDAPWFLSQQQRFYVASATNFRGKSTDAYLRMVVSSDTHSPGAIRSIQPARNTDTFYEAFDIKPGDPMYIAPEDRVVIW